MLREAISERASRARGDDHHDWKEGDKPRVSLGAHVRFCNVFPAPWDLLVTHGGKRYALLDRYRVDEDADEVPIAIEVIDLVAGASVGNGEGQTGSCERSRQARPAVVHTKVHTFGATTRDILKRVETLGP